MKFDVSVVQRSDNDGNMIPMINVVFLLLAFFIMVGQIQRMSVLSIDPPKSLSQIPQEQLEFNLQITSENDLYIDKNPIERADLKQSLEAIRSEASADAEIELLVRADAALPARDLQSILRTVFEAGIVNISLATQPAFSVET